MLTAIQKATVNATFDMKLLLGELGVYLRGEGSIYCPFHDDTGGGHKSAKYYSSNSIYCWSCAKAYYPYDALRLLGYSDEAILSQISSVSPVSIQNQQKRSLFGGRGIEVSSLKKQFVQGTLPLIDYLSKLIPLMEVTKHE